MKALDCRIYCPGRGAQRGTGRLGACRALTGGRKSISSGSWQGSPGRGQTEGAWACYQMAERQIVPTLVCLLGGLSKLALS